MIRIEMRIALNYQVDPFGADFVFKIHAARTASQSNFYENLQLTQPIQAQIPTDPGQRQPQHAIDSPAWQPPPVVATFDLVSILPSLRRSTRGQCGGYLQK